MIHEMETPWDGGKKGKDPPISMKMDRGEEQSTDHSADGERMRNGGK
jgi:hypothetical protein